MVERQKAQRLHDKAAQGAEGTTEQETGSKTERGVDGISDLAQASEQLLEGVTEAVRKGYGEFTKTLTSENLSKPDFGKIVFQGALKGWVSAINEAALGLQKASKTFLTRGKG